MDEAEPQSEPRDDSDLAQQAGALAKGFCGQQVARTATRTQTAVRAEQLAAVERTRDLQVLDAGSLAESLDSMWTLCPPGPDCISPSGNSPNGGIDRFGEL